MQSDSNSSSHSTNASESESLDGETSSTDSKHNEHELVDRLLRNQSGQARWLIDTTGTTSLDAENEANWLLASDLPNRFEVRGVLGRGAYGVVFLAHDRRLQREVAIKILRPEWMSNAATKERFLRESRAAARLNHSSIVRVLEADENEKIVWQVCDVVYGATLTKHLQRGRLQPRIAARLVAKLAHAVDYACAQGIYHRDIKPDNVLINALPGESLRKASVFLTDFGMAKMMDDQLDLSGSGIVLGTPRYMAPEQFDGTASGDYASADIYSLGVILFESLTGVCPFKDATTMAQRIRMGLTQSPSPRDLDSSVPRDLDRICRKAMDAHISDRYATAHDLAQDLNNYLRGLPIQACPIPFHEQFWRLVKQNRLLMALVGAVFLALLSVVGVLINSERKLDSQNDVLNETNRQLKKERDRAETLASISGTLRAEAETERAKYKEIAWNTGIREAYRNWEDGRFWEAEQRLNQLKVSHPDESQRFEWKALKAQLRSRVKETYRCDAPLTEVRPIPHTTLLAVATGKGKLAIVESLTSKVIREIDTGVDSLHSLAVHPSGDWIAVGGSKDRQVDLVFPMLYDWKSGTLVRKYEGMSTTLESLEFTADGDQLLCGSRYENMKLMRVDGNGSKELPAARRNTWIAHLPASSKFVFQRNREQLCEFDYRDGDAAKAFDVPSAVQGEDFVVAATPVGSTPWIAVAVSNQRFGIAILDSRTWRIVGRLSSVGRNLRCLVSSQNGALIAAGLENGECMVWDVHNEPWFQDESRADQEEENVLVFTPIPPVSRWQLSANVIHSIAIANGQLICASEDGRLISVSLEEPTSKSPVLSVANNTAPTSVWDVAWRNDGNQIAMRNHEGVVYLVDLKQLNAHELKEDPQQIAASRLQLSHREYHLGNYLSDAEPLYQPGKDHTAMQGVFFSGDGKTLVWPFSRKEIQFSQTTGKRNIPEVLSEDESSEGYNIVGISNDANWIAIGAPSRTLRLIRTHPPFGTGHSFPLPGTASCADWHPDGSRVFVGGNFDTLIECNLSDGTQRVVSTVNSETFALRCAGDGSFVVSGHGDGGIRLSQTKNRSCEVVQVHSAAVRSLAVTSDDRIGVSVDWDDNVAIWMIPTRERLAVLEAGCKSIRDSQEVLSSVWIAHDASQFSVVSSDSTHGPVVRNWTLGRSLQIP